MVVILHVKYHNVKKKIQKEKIPKIYNFVNNYFTTQVLNKVLDPYIRIHPICVLSWLVLNYYDFDQYPDTPSNRQ